MVLSRADLLSDKDNHAYGAVFAVPLLGVLIKALLEGFNLIVNKLAHFLVIKCEFYKRVVLNSGSYFELVKLRIAGFLS